jgi:hypothetical protein
MQTPTLFFLHKIQDFLIQFAPLQFPCVATAPTPAFARVTTEPAPINLDWTAIPLFPDQNQRLKKYDHVHPHFTFYFNTLIGTKGQIFTVGRAFSAVPDSAPHSS